jgi:hypothetical protein
MLRLAVIFFRDYKKIFFIIILSHFFNINTQAQCDSSCCEKPCKMSCCSKDLSPLSTMVSHAHPKGEWMFSYRYMLMSMGGNYQAGNALSDEMVFNNYLMSPKHMMMNMHMIMAMYGISDRFTAMVMLHLNHSHMSMNMPNSSHSNHSHSSEHQHHNHGMNSFGLADTKIQLLYALYEKGYHRLLLHGGFSLPTGSLSVRGHDEMYAQSPLPYAMQLGTGTADFIPGITYTYQHKKITASAQVQYTARMYNNPYNYRWGNEWNASSWLGYKLNQSWGLAYKIDFWNQEKMKGFDSRINPILEPAANFANYGGTTLSNSFSTHLFLGKHRISIECGIPIYQKRLGIQMHRIFDLMVGWQMYL